MEFIGRQAEAIRGGPRLVRPPADAERRNTGIGSCTHADRLENATIPAMAGRTDLVLSDASGVSVPSTREGPPRLSRFHHPEDTMILIRIRLFFLCIALAAAPNALGADKVGTADKAALQAAMRQHINRQLIDGNYLDVNLSTGAVRSLHPVTAHPVLLRMGEYFVLCTDFRDGSGKPVNVDFYLARRAKGFVVFRADVDNHGALDRLMATGKVERLE
jgi:hypothetical protein